MPIDQRARAGVSLLEVLVAIVLIGSSGSAWLLLLAQTRHSMDAAHAQEFRADGASRLLRDVAQRSDSTLLTLVGRRRIGELELQVSIIAPQLFELLIVEPGRGTLLRTVAYRPHEALNAP